MTHSFLPVFSALALLASPALAQDSEMRPATEVEMAEVAQLIEAAEQWEAYYEAGEWEQIRTLYTDDAVLMTHGVEKISGADNIVAFLQRLGNMGASVNFDINVEEAVIRGDMGFLTSLYRMTIVFPGSEEPTIVTGRSYIVYIRSEDGWLLWRDMDNQAPDAGPEAFE